MRLRRIAACAAAALALTGLAACGTKAGAAAFVGGERISQSDVNGYLLPGFTASPATSSGQQQEPPRVFTLDTLITDRLMSTLLDSLGGVPSDAQLAAMHDKALAVQYQLQQTGAAADATVRDALTRIGVRASFVQPFLRAAELRQAVIDKIKATQPSDIAAAVKQHGIDVRVNGRFGTWSADQVSLTTYKPPDFIQLGTS